MMKIFFKIFLYEFFFLRRIGRAVSLDFFKLDSRATLPYRQPLRASPHHLLRRLVVLALHTATSTRVLPCMLSSRLQRVSQLSGNDGICTVASRYAESKPM